MYLHKVCVARKSSVSGPRLTPASAWELRSALCRSWGEKVESVCKEEVEEIHTKKDAASTELVLADIDRDLGEVSLPGDIPSEIVKLTH